MISKYNKCYGKKQGNFLRNLDKNYFSNIIGLDNDNDLLYKFNIFVYKKGILGINEPSCHLVNEDWTISLFISSLPCDNDLAILSNLQTINVSP